MSTDLSYTEKFVLQVERLRRSDIKTAEFDVHFLAKVIEEIQNEHQEINIETPKNTSSVDGGNFK
jgi:hypothetical protein